MPTASIHSVKEMVEAVILSLNLSPEDHRIQIQGSGPAWGLMKGSAQVFIFIQPSVDEENQDTIQVLAPIIKVPPDSASCDELYRFLLDMNMSELSGCAFAMKSDTVVITARRSTVALDPAEVEEMVLKVGYYADIFDDLLASRFQAKRYAD